VIKTISEDPEGRSKQIKRLKCFFVVKSLMISRGGGGGLLACPRSTIDCDDKKIIVSKNEKIFCVRASSRRESSPCLLAEEVEKLIHYAGNFLSNRSNFSFEVQIKKSPPLSLLAREAGFFFVCKRISGLSRRSAAAAAAAARLQNGNDINHNNIVSPLRPKEEDSSRGDKKNERKRSLDRNHFYFP
jgi:hypothetical protein